MLDAHFNKAFDLLLGREGTYSNDPDDRGAETYKGISRANYPHWEGWNTVDNYRQKPDFPEVLESLSCLRHKVKEFYKILYWYPLKGNDISALSFDVAFELFDTGVNMGIYQASLFLQQSLNALNKSYQNPPAYTELVADGKIGPKTLSALARHISYYRTPDRLLKLMNILQGFRYYELMSKSETQEKYAGGWLSRVEISRR